MVGEYAAPVGEKRLGAPYVCMVIASVNVIQKGEGRFLTVQRGRLTVGNLVTVYGWFNEMTECLSCGQAWLRNKSDAVVVVQIHNCKEADRG